MVEKVELSNYYKVKKKVVFITNAALLALLVFLSILLNIMDNIKDDGITKIIAIAGISLFFIFVIFNFIVFFPNLYITFNLSRKVNSYISQEKYNDGILYLETILRKTKNYEVKYCAEYYLGYLAFLKNDIDKSISYLNKYEKNINGFNVEIITSSVFILYLVFYRKKEEQLQQKLYAFYVSNKPIFTRLSKNNIGIVRMLNIIEQLHSNNLKQAIIQLKCCKIYEARFIQEFVEEIDSLNR